MATPSPAPAPSGYVPGQGATQAATGSFPGGLDFTGLGISQAELTKKIPTGPPPPPAPPLPNDFSTARGGLNGPGNAPPPPVQPERPSVTFGFALSNLGTMSPDNLQALQQQMYTAHLFPASYYKKGGPDPVTGMPDATTIVAYTKVLRLAYNTQQQVTDVIGRLAAQHPELAGAVGPADVARQVSLTHPADLAVIADSAASKLLGRQATTAEKTQFTNAYHQQEMQAQQAATAPQFATVANPNGSGAPVMAQPSASAAADQFFRQSNPTGVGVHSGLGIADAIMRMFQAPAGSGGIT